MRVSGIGGEVVEQFVEGVRELMINLFDPFHLCSSYFLTVYLRYIQLYLFLYVHQTLHLTSTTLCHNGIVLHPSI